MEWEHIVHVFVWPFVTTTLKQWNWCILCLMAEPTVSVLFPQQVWKVTRSAAVGFSLQLSKQIEAKRESQTELWMDRRNVLMKRLYNFIQHLSAQEAQTYICKWLTEYFKYWRWFSLCEIHLCYWEFPWHWVITKTGDGEELGFLTSSLNVLACMKTESATPNCLRWLK